MYDLKLNRSLRDATMAKLVFCSLRGDRGQGRQIGLEHKPSFMRLRALFFDEGDTAIARMFAALHLVNGHDFEVSDLYNLQNLKLVDSDKIKIGIHSLEDLKKWTVKLLTHPRAQKVFRDIIDTTFPALQNPVHVPPVELVKNVVFFDLDNDPELWAFSGIGTVYVNCSSLRKGLESFTIEGTANIEMRGDLSVKLMVAAIGLFEAANMAVRKVQNDLLFVPDPNIKFHNLGNSPGAIAQVRFFDLPLLNWGEYYAADSTIVEKIFKYCCEDTKEPPEIPVHGLNTTPTPQLQLCLYKMPTERLGY
eukprot:Phypoly_transcript_05155.p1 GENE.Phypoly_transcript_05155~~Phypoly_transcript_05155.p1  ORF type:complete len:306 (+),score=24.87 Phypoly_transcript_05155:1024-1941(+)